MEPGTPAAPDAFHLLDATMFWNPSGGVRRYIGAKRRWALQHTGGRHTVATPAPDGSAMLRVPSLPLPGSAGAYRLPWRRRATAALLCGVAPDLIESADPYRLAWSALDAAHALGVPAVAFCHSDIVQLAQAGGGRVAARIARRYAVRLYNRFDRVFAPSLAMAAQLADWGVHGVVHQPLGVDTRVFHPSRASANCRHALGLPQGARVLVYAGRFAPEKNLPVLERAVERLGPRYWLLAVGAGPVVPSGPRTLVRRTVLDPTTLATLLASCDAFVHAGAHETFGLSVLEALACGVPVVARAAGGLAERVDESVGAAVRSADPTAFADAFADAVTSVFERDRDALRRAARARAEANDWSQVLPPLWAHYRALLHGPATHARGAASRANSGVRGTEVPQ